MGLADVGALLAGGTGAVVGGAGTPGPADIGALFAELFEPSDTVRGAADPPGASSDTVRGAADPPGTSSDTVRGAAGSCVKFVFGA